MAYGIGSTKKQPGCDKSKQGLIDVTNSIVAQAITQTINECFIDATLEQDVEMTCTPRVEQTDLPNVTVFEENEACGVCMENALKDAQAQNKLERAMWVQSPARVRQPINAMYAQMIETIEDVWADVLQGLCADKCDTEEYSEINRWLFGDVYDGESRASKRVHPSPRTISE